MAPFRRFPGSWRRLGDVPPERTAPAFAELDRATAALCAAAGLSAADGLAWRDDGSMLATGLHGSTEFGIRPADLAVLSLAADGAVTDRLFLHGRSAADLAAWVARVLGSGMPSTPTDARPFDASDRPAFCEAARWLNNADDAFDRAGVGPRYDARSGRLAARLPATGAWLALETRPAPAFVVESGDPGAPPLRLEAREFAQQPASVQTARVASFLDRATGHAAWER